MIAVDLGFNRGGSRFLQNGHELTRFHFGDCRPSLQWAHKIEGG